MTSTVNTFVGTHTVTTHSEETEDELIKTDLTLTSPCPCTPLAYSAIIHFLVFLKPMDEKGIWPCPPQLNSVHSIAK